MKLKNKTKESVVYISIFFSIVLMFALILQNWLNSESVVVIASTQPTTTPSPTPTAGQAVKVEEEVVDKYQDLIKEIFGDEWETAYAIAMAESHMGADKVHKDENEWSIGLFQINIRKGDGEGAKVHWEKIPGDTGEEKEAWLMKPRNNILTAKFLYGSSGFYPWSVYKSGVYKEFLPAHDEK